jgi:ABC-type lipoprotein export system ATPase subunit
MKPYTHVTDEKHTKARFWKCALQVNPAGYINYRGGGHSMTEDQYNQELLRAALENNIKVIGLADHGNVDGIDAIRDVMKECGIIVFPGFEIASSEKVHFVCLFSENTTTTQLHRYLGELGNSDPQDGVRPSKLSAEQLLQKVDEMQGFAYAAHCTDEHGVLEHKFNHVWKSIHLKAAQIPGSIEDLPNIYPTRGHGFSQIIRNKNLEYYRAVPIAVINAKDVVVPDDLSNPKASCLIKMTMPCFESFKLAFQDPDSRVRLNSDVTEKYYSRIEDLKVIGGYLDGVRINFSEHLNAVIGGRGTGKSTLLECIRYTLNLRPIGKNAQRQHDEIIKENLGKSKARAELTIRSATMNGKRFTIARRYGESAVVKDESGVASSFTPQDLLPGIEFYGQNEIYEIAQDSGGQRRLLARFLDTDDQSSGARIAEVMTKLRENRKQIIEAQENVAVVEDEVARLPKLREQAEQFKNLGLEEKLKIVPKLENEKRLDQRVQEDINSLELALAAIPDSLPDIAFLSETVLEVLPHAKTLRTIRTLLETIKIDVEKTLTQLNFTLGSHKTALTDLRSSLTEAIKHEEDGLEKTFKELPSCEGRNGKEIGMQFQSLMRDIERIRPKEALLINRKAIVEGFFRTRKSLLDELSSIRSERSSQFERALRKINKKLAGKLKLTVSPEADRTPLIKYLIGCNLDGVAEGRLAWIKTADDFSPVKLAELIALGPEKLKDANWGITNTVAEALTRLSLAQQMEIAEIELPDIIKIELNVAHEGAENYRDLNKLSTGQQCTAILHLLLLENPDPLIMDQPEDNLDNAFIADRIVAELRSAKIARQFIVATHNANIPVFGDAEWIGVFGATEEQATLPAGCQGAIDVPLIRDKAAEILEGGKTAFNQRKAKYGF